MIAIVEDFVRTFSIEQKRVIGTGMKEAKKA
jgi:hypothetical protein